ncbi:MAG TPA: ATP-binding cassette domain-containing protein, partial [Smithella sp.]|nr:ATP-binding cassette domain-containing protein [Smithella sp.]
MTKAPESPPSMVDVRNVTMRFKSVEAVKDISLQIPKGHVLGLVGSDGAGKSTLLRLVATMIQPTSGNIYIDGL